ncbi:ribonuclease Z [Cuneatibacter sp. NSJ-177]|uniref:ribonuclease Z n=1 Tax=Cuneatibacter sp. NSJ-177 TaxID=2931401 RepID=UPI001FD61E98|nr:ribonuclease Z [Cuneatibacter sp. NSJ-177]MCJ7835317.1 ribonuclease Z [Cuneatibacter sp. NSJ-177]
MFDVCLLGTGGMMPLPYRWLTSLMVRYEGSQLMIDCGEGTQIAAKEKGWSFKPIDVLCFTHYHADHISGLPGLLLTMGNAERTEPLLLIGPKGLERVVCALKTIAPELPFPLEFLELTEREQEIQAGPYQIHAFRVNHNIVCYGYSISIPRAGKFQVEKAKELGLPVQYWNPLQKGNSVTYEGKTYTPDLVMGPERRGLKVTYCTDTRPTPAIVEAARSADLFICEGMYGEPGKEQKAVEHKHMTFAEAARIAKEAQPKEMWLTHFSPSLNRPEEYMDDVRRIFPRAKAGKDGKTKELKFDEE